MAESKTSSKDKKKMTKAIVFKQIATTTGLTNKQVSEVFEVLTTIIKDELGKKGPGEFTIPGLLKLKLTRKKATKERTGTNPFDKTKTMVFKAKPARNVIKARALKPLLEAIK